MAKEITYRLDYVDETGKKLSKNIRINFVSNQMREDFRLIENDIIDGYRLSNEYNALMIEIRARSATGKSVDDIEAKVESLNQKFQNILEKGNLEQRRIQLAQKILIKNGFQSSDKFVSDEFWNGSVDVETINEFLTVAIDKDLDKVKKKNQKMTEISPQSTTQTD